MRNVVKATQTVQRRNKIGQNWKKIEIRKLIYKVEYKGINFLIAFELFSSLLFAHNCLI